MIRLIRTRHVVMVLAALLLVVIGLGAYFALRPSEKAARWTPDDYVTLVRGSYGAPAINEVDDDAIFTLGQTVCRELDDGQSIGSLGVYLMAADDEASQLPDGTVLTLDDREAMPIPISGQVAGAIVGGAIHTYCPDHQDLIDEAS